MLSSAFLWAVGAMAIPGSIIVIASLVAKIFEYRDHAGLAVTIRCVAYVGIFLFWVMPALDQMGQSISYMGGKSGFDMTVHAPTIARGTWLNPSFGNSGSGSYESSSFASDTDTYWNSINGTAKSIEATTVSQMQPIQQMWNTQMDAVHWDRLIAIPRWVVHFATGN